MGFDDEDSEESYDDFAEYAPKRRRGGRGRGGRAGRGRRRRRQQQYVEEDSDDEFEAYVPAKKGRGRRRQRQTRGFEPYSGGGGRGRGGGRRRRQSGGGRKSVESLEAQEARLKEQLERTKQSLLQAKHKKLKSELGRLEKQMGRSEKKSEPKTEEEKKAALDRELEEYKYGPAAPSGFGKSSSSSKRSQRDDDVFSKIRAARQGDATAERQATQSLDDDLDNYFSKVGQGPSTRVSFNTGPVSTSAKTTYEEPRTNGASGGTRAEALRRSIVASLEDQQFKLRK